MTSNRAGKTTNLAQIADDLERLLNSKTDDLKNRTSYVRGEINRIETLSHLNDDEERSKALSEFSASLRRAEQVQREVRKTAGFGGMATPIKSVKHLLAVRSARDLYNRASAELDAPETKARRTIRISNHNNLVDREHARLHDLGEQKNLLDEKRLAIDQLRYAAVDAIRAARDDGWRSPGFPQQFQQLASFTENNDIEGAIDCLSKLTFQRRPTNAFYEKLTAEAMELRAEAYKQYAGIAALGAYTEIAQNSIRLASFGLQTRNTDCKDAFVHPADQWQALSASLADPKRYRVDAIWAIYWAMHQFGQWAANEASESDAHEDVFTGKVSAKLDHWLGNWAAQRVTNFGYTEVQSYFGTLEIASTTEETRLGADIGLIVDLNIGGLVCRKIALFQAKKSKHGVANIGSSAGQLKKISLRSNAGFYLFYHQATHPVMAPAPTVAIASELVNKAIKANKDVNATNLQLDVSTMGWDWASFIAFGLCNPDSEVGKSFNTAGEALSAMGNGDACHLPKYLHFIAITDKSRVRELRAKIYEHYRESTLTMDKARGPSRRISNDRGGPRNGMSR